MHFVCEGCVPSGQCLQKASAGHQQKMEVGKCSRWLHLAFSLQMGLESSQDKHTNL